MFFQAWGYRKIGFVIASIVVFIGLIIAFTKPASFEATSTLLVESNTSSSLGNLMQNYGGLLGINGSNNQEGVISSNLYPDVISSLPFQLELIEQKLTFSSYDTTTTIYNFFTSIYDPGFYFFLKNYTVGLNTLENQFDKPDKEPLDDSWKKENPINLPSTQLAVAKGISEQLEITVEDDKVTISAWMPDPQAASELVNVVRELLSKHVIEYRTEKAKKDLEFVQQQYQQAKRRFTLAQDSLAHFRDENRNLATAAAQTKEQRLQSEYDLTFQVYHNLAQQLEEARIKVQRNTPIFSTLHPVVVPTSPAAPNRALIFSFSCFLGVLLGAFVMGGIVVLKKFYNENNLK